jgi:Leucine-rich repeat (LRR) protein
MPSLFYFNKYYAMNPFDILDYDSLFCILDYLDHKTINKCIFINKQLNKGAKNDLIWKKFCHEHFSDEINDNYYVKYGKINYVNHLFRHNKRNHKLKKIYGSSVNMLSCAPHSLNNVPPEIEVLTYLTTLEIEIGILDRISPEIGKLTKLRCLSFYKNKLKAIPPEIGSLTNLEILHLQGNQLIKIPGEVGLLTNLRELYLSENRLNDLPPEIGKLVKLTCVFANDNSLMSIPSEIGNLSNLTRLSLSRNHLRTIPKEISLLHNLISLNLVNNLIIVDIPEEVKKMASYHSFLF